MSKECNGVDIKVCREKFKSRLDMICSDIEDEHMIKKIMEAFDESVKVEEDEYCFSFDGEDYSMIPYDAQVYVNNLEIMAQCIMNEYGKEEVYIGKVKYIKEEDIVPTDIADEILEIISDYAYCKYGEVAEVFSEGVMKDEKEELNDNVRSAIIEWLKEHSYDINVFLVEEVKKYTAREMVSLA